MKGRLTIALLLSLALLLTTACNGTVKTIEVSSPTSTAISTQATQATISTKGGTEMTTTTSDTETKAQTSAASATAATKSTGRLQGSISAVEMKLPAEWDVGVEEFQPKTVTTKGLGKKTVYYLKINQILKSTKTLEHDVWRLVSSFQGVMNRDFKKTDVAVYVEFNDNAGNDDAFWFQYMSSPGKFLHGYTVQEITTLAGFVSTFINQLLDMGIAAWDPAVPATANVAATACGLYNYMPVQYNTQKDSLYTLLMNNRIPVKMNYVGMFTGRGKIPGSNVDSTGSAKNDAYYWAAFNYLSKTSTGYLAYYVDGASSVVSNPIYKDGEGKQGGHVASIPNHDFYIAKRTFFFDLMPYDDEKPCDDPDQKMGTDYETYKRIATAQYYRNDGQIISAGGHIPWHLKYSEHNGFGNKSILRAEELWAAFSSSLNIVSEADAAHPAWMTNASLYNQYPQRSSYANHTPVPTTYDPNKIYMMFLIGDYDGSSWTKRAIKEYGSIANRGTRPLMWNFDPNMVERLAPMFDYLYESSTPYDYYATCNSGAGNIEPASLFHSLRDLRELPDGGDALVKWSRYYYGLFNMDITGWTYGMTNLDAKLLNAYEQFSPAGVIHCETGKNNVVVKYKDTLFVQGDAHAISTKSMGTQELTQRACNSAYSKVRDGYNFSVFRTVQYSFDEVIALQDSISAAVQSDARFQGKTVEWVDPYTFFDMIKKHGKISRTVS